MTQEEKYMKAAIREAKKAYALEEVPIGCVIVQNDRIIARVTTGEIQREIHWRTRSLPRSKRRAKRLATGGWKTAQCMSH